MKPVFKADATVLPILIVLLSGLLPGAGYGQTSAAVSQLLMEYRTAGAGDFSAGDGAAFWQRTYQSDRSCARCHGADPRAAGKHIRTGKVIKPMAPSVNPQRLTEQREIRKWLFRNCKGTLGRECTAQEKGDVLTWLSDQ